MSAAAGHVHSTLINFFEITVHVRLLCRYFVPLSEGSSSQSGKQLPLEEDSPAILASSCSDRLLSSVLGIPFIPGGHVGVLVQQLGDREIFNLGTIIPAGTSPGTFSTSKSL